jgi:peptide/nickel transport system permease protein
MLSFVLSRLVRMLITIFALVSIVFFATRFTGDAIDYLMPEGLDPEGRAAMMAYWGLDRSLLEQYILFWRSIFEGHFGLSLLERRPVEVIFGERIFRSLLLLSATLAVTMVIGIPAGVAAAVWRKSTLGSLILAVAFVGYSIPNFILAIILILVFSFTLHWLPSSGAASLVHFVMPTLALSAYFAAALVRYTRNAMLDVLSQDYVRTARAKVLSEFSVIFKHGLSNALIPIVTVIGLQITTLVSGAVVVETVFALNGSGDLLVGATLRRDYPVRQFGVLVVASAVVIVNIVIDCVYAALDPRVRLSGGAS